MLDDRNDMPIEVPVVQSRNKNWKSSKSQKSRRRHVDTRIVRSKHRQKEKPRREHECIVRWERKERMEES